MAAKESEYGTWKSPISSKLATASSLGFMDLQLDRAPGRADVVYWAEMRFEEGGRHVICSQKIGQKDITEWTPKGFNARTKVHEYGGGAFIVFDGVVYFTNFDDQVLYSQTSPDAKPEPLVPTEKEWRHADGEFHYKLKKIYAICEDHGVVKEGKTKEAENTVVVFNPQTKQQHTLVSGCNFYSSPRVSPDGRQIAWIQWNHPNMPWDDTELWSAELEESGEAVKQGSAKKVAGGPTISIMYCRWTTDNELLYISDQTNWWNLYHVTSSGEHVNLIPKDAELGYPQWVFAYNAYDVDPSGSGKVVVTYAGKFAIYNLKTKEYKELDTGFTTHTYVQFSTDGAVYCVVGSSTRFPCVARIDSTSGQVTVIKESCLVPVDSGYLSTAQPVTWPTAGDKEAHGFFYPPQNKDFKAPSGTLPPLLVRVHGGPTDACHSTLDLMIQYFTSRGFGILDTNYRGSTGYGKAYRNGLYLNWGVCDVEDCSSGAKYLASSGRVDGSRLCIDGGSAGGYTTLACLAFTDTFKAGASYYGVADIALLVAETHKFESRYVANLVAPYDDEHMHIFEERSPGKHVDLFNCPIAFFQGDEDEIVPYNQAEIMYNAVKAKGLPCLYLLFKGEQHYFRKSENIQKSLDGEFYFFAKVFGFEPADQHCKLEITNLK